MLCPELADWTGLRGPVQAAALPSVRELIPAASGRGGSNISQMVLCSLTVVLLAGSAAAARPLILFMQTPVECWDQQDQIP